MDLNEARIYVGTYAKYNNGSLQGVNDNAKVYQIII